MSYVALFTIDKVAKQPKSSSIDKWVKLLRKACAHTQNGILPIHKKNEFLPFAPTLMDLEGIMLSEISQKNTNTDNITCIWNLKNKAKSVAHRYRLVDARESGEGR